MKPNLKTVKDALEQLEAYIFPIENFVIEEVQEKQRELEIEIEDFEKELREELEKAKDAAKIQEEFVYRQALEGRVRFIKKLLGDDDE